MRLLGLIGGMSWESTAIYYRHLNELARDRLGGLHSARLLLWSVDFAEIAELQHRGEWAAAGEIAGGSGPPAGGGRGRGAGPVHQHHAQAGRHHSGVRSASRCCTSPTPPVRRSSPPAAGGPPSWRPGSPWSSRSTPTACGSGTAWTRSSPTSPVGPWCTRSSTRSSAAASCAPNRRRATSPRSTGCAQRVPTRVILGCTEIGMLISQADLDLPVFDTTRLHAEAAMDFALAGCARLRRRPLRSRASSRGCRTGSQGRTSSDGSRAGSRWSMSAPAG